jgi:hypothetical protein
MRSGSVIALLVAVAFVAPSAAGAAATHEDRAFAHAFERYDARARQILADPAPLAALRARQQAGAGCIDAARALAQADHASQERDFEAQLFYSFYATDPFVEPLLSAGRDYGAALARLHLHGATLRSARAVLQLVLVGIKLPPAATLSDFCGPLRAWQAAGFAASAEPQQVKAVVTAVFSTPDLTTHRRAIMRRAADRMRAAGMSRSVRGDLAQAGNRISVDAFLRGDQILQALQS